MAVAKDCDGPAVPSTVANQSKLAEATSDCSRLFVLTSAPAPGFVVIVSSLVSEAVSGSASEDNTHTALSTDVSPTAPG